MSPNKLKFQDDFYMPLFLSHRKRNRDIALEQITKMQKESTTVASDQVLHRMVENSTKKATNVVPKVQVQSKMVETENPYAKKYKSYRRDRSKSSLEPKLTGRKTSDCHTCTGVSTTRELAPKIPVANYDNNAEGVLKEQLSFASQKDLAHRQGDKKEEATQRVVSEERLSEGTGKSGTTVIDLTNDGKAENNLQAKHSSAVSPCSDLKMKIRYQRHVRPKRKVVIPEHDDFVYNFPLPNRKRARTASPTIITDAKILREQTDDEIVLVDREEIVTNDNAEGLQF